jgi:hypothetical protein
LALDLRAEDGILIGLVGDHQVLELPLHIWAMITLLHILKHGNPSLHEVLRSHFDIGTLYVRLVGLLLLLLRMWLVHETLRVGTSRLVGIHVMNTHHKLCLLLLLTLSTTSQKLGAQYVGGDLKQRERVRSMDIPKQKRMSWGKM